MDCIDKYKRVEEDQTQGKGKAKVFPKKRDPQGGGYHNNCPRRDFPSQTSSVEAQVVNSLFKEPIYQILEKIKNESYFKLSNKINGDLFRRNQSLYYHYHQEKDT